MQRPAALASRAEAATRARYPFIPARPAGGTSPVQTACILGGGFVLLLSLGCASAGGPRDLKLAGKPARPFSAHLKLQILSEGKKDDELASRLRRALEEQLRAYNTFTLLHPDGEAEPGDVGITVTVRDATLREGDYNVQGMLLDILAWSTVPPIALWVRDVEYHFGITINVEATWAGQRVFEDDGPGPKPYPTSLADRRSFWRDPWPYLACILVPPCVFSGHTPEHLQGELQDSFLLDASQYFAERIKEELAPATLKHRGAFRNAALVMLDTEKLVEENTARLDIELPFGMEFTQFDVTVNGVPAASSPRGRDRLLLLMREKGWVLGKLTPGRHRIQVKTTVLSTTDVDAGAITETPAEFSFVVDVRESPDRTPSGEREPGLLSDGR